VGGSSLGLGSAFGAEAEAGEVAVADVAGVGDLGVAHEVEATEHGPGV
jgi:hypothetical protein